MGPPITVLTHRLDKSFLSVILFANKTLSCVFRVPERFRMSGCVFVPRIFVLASNCLQLCVVIWSLFLSPNAFPPFSTNPPCQGPASIWELFLLLRLIDVTQCFCHLIGNFTMSQCFTFSGLNQKIRFTLGYLKIRNHFTVCSSRSDLNLLSFK